MLDRSPLATVYRLDHADGRHAGLPRAGCVKCLPIPNPKLTAEDYAHYHVDGPPPDAPSRVRIATRESADEIAAYMTRRYRGVGIPIPSYTVRSCDSPDCR